MIDFATQPATGDAERDMRERWRPTDEQITIAVAMLAAAPPNVTHVAVPVALPGKMRSWWQPGQRVEAAPGFWLADADAHDGPHAFHAATIAADRAAARHLGKRPGQSGWATIDRSGDWAVWEGVEARDYVARDGTEPDDAYQFLTELQRQDLADEVFAIVSGEPDALESELLDLFDRYGVRWPAEASDS